MGYRTALTRPHVHPYTVGSTMPETTRNTPVSDRQSLRRTAATRADQYVGNLRTRRPELSDDAIRLAWTAFVCGFMRDRMAPPTQPQ
jgi:hypothetical protein